MKNRLGAVKVAQEFSDAFNRHALQTVKTMLDEQVVYSQQNMEGSLIGKGSVVNKLKARFEAAAAAGETAKTAIVDLSDTKAHPCMVILRGDIPTSLILFDIKINNLIRSITVLTNPDAVAKARITKGR